MAKEPNAIYVVEDASDTRLDRWLKKQVSGLQQGVLEKHLRLGKIRVNDRKVKAGERLNNGDVITVFVDLTEQVVARAEPEFYEAPVFSGDEKEWFESLILWEDEDLLVLNKPHGLAVQGGTKTQRHVDYYLTALGQSRNCRYRLVHRIDRDTSGVLLVAKSATVAAFLTAAFKNGDIDKTYWAVVVGHPKPGIGKVKAPLLKAGSGDREKVVVDFEEGKPAVTIYRTVKKLISKRLPELTWLELEPETGRTHQIRVHCAHLGTPIFGDGKYGGRQATEFTRDMHLHARTLRLKDHNGNNFSFSAPPPPHFVHTLELYNLTWDKI